MLQSWYQKTAQSQENTLVSFSLHYMLPEQHYNQLKTPLFRFKRLYFENGMVKFFS